MGWYKKQILIGILILLFLPNSIPMQVYGTNYNVTIIISSNNEAAGCSIKIDSVTHHNNDVVSLSTGTHTCEAVTPSQWGFIDWLDVANTPVSDSNNPSTTFTVYGNGLIGAEWGPIVTFYASPSSGGTISVYYYGASTPYSDTYSNGQSGIIKGASSELRANSATNYVFSSWQTTGSVSVNSPSSTPTYWSPTGPGTVTANFAGSLSGSVTGLTANPTRASRGQTVQISATVTNTGTIQADYHLYTEAGSLFDYVSGTIRLNPGQSGTITLNCVVPSSAALTTYSVNVRFEMAQVGGIWQNNQICGSVQITVADGIPPTVDSLSISSASITQGSSFTISYSVSDTGGSGLLRVELWRTTDSGGSPNAGGWAEVTRVSVSGNSYSSSFSDSPSSGVYWYGIHVVDNAGNTGMESSPVKGTVVSNTLSVSVSANPTSITTTQSSTITVTVTSGGTAVSGATVTLTKDGGSLTSTSGTTDSNGRFTSTFSSGSANTFTITASASKTGYNPGSGNTQVTVTQSPLNAPSGLSATAVSSSRIDLSWTDNSGDESNFRIERKTGSGGTWSEIATVSANTVSYQDTGLSAGTTYYYRVRAYRSSDGAYSSYSSEASATTSSGETTINIQTPSTNFDYIGLEDNLNVEIKFDVTGSLSLAPAAYFAGILFGNKITVTYEIQLYQDMALPLLPDKFLRSLTFSRTIEEWQIWGIQTKITLEDGQEYYPDTADEARNLLFSVEKSFTIKGKELGWIFHEGTHQIYAIVRVSWTAYLQIGAGSTQWKGSERKTVVVSGTSINSGNAVFLYETGERLYLHVYDAEGHHTGRNYTTNQTEIGIPGSSYEEYSEGICIILPENVTSFSYIVDAQYATQPQENYTVFLRSVKEGQMIQMASRNMTIQKDEEQEGKVKVMQSEISLGINSLPRIIWFDIPTQVYQNEMLIARINVSDQEGLGQVNFVLLEDMGRMNYIGQLNISIYEFRINMSAYTPGAYNCYITAEDTDGAVVTTSTKVLKIDGILKLESVFSHDILSSGENTTLIATLRDYFNNFVTNAIINVTIAGQTFLFTDRGDGTYQAIIKTNELPSPQGLGENFVANIIAEKQYYDTAEQQLNLFIRPWWWPYLPYLISVPLVIALLTMSALLLRKSRRAVVKAPEEGLIMASPEVIQALKGAKVSFDKGFYAPAVVSASERLRSELINQLRLRQSCTNEEIAETLNRTNMDINRNEVISILKLADKCKFDEYLPTQNEARESLEKASNILKKLEKPKKA